MIFWQVVRSHASMLQQVPLGDGWGRLTRGTKNGIPRALWAQACGTWKMPWPSVSSSSPLTGSPYYDNVRPLCYSDSDAVLLCFDISRPETVDSALKKVSLVHSTISSSV